MFLRRLHADSAPDDAVARQVFLATPGYEIDTFGRLPSAEMAQPLWERFPAECAPGHRLTLAAFDHDTPIGLAQIALHLPDAHSAALLMLIVSPTARRQHAGCEIVERLSRQARRWPGIGSWYLNVAETNAAALSFWRHCGFRTVSTGLRVPGLPHALLAMTRPVKTRPLCQRHGEPEDATAADARHIFARLG